MESEIIIVLASVGVAIVLMMTEVLRADIVALLLALFLTLSGEIAPEETFAGFSRPAVITILAIFILTNGLYRTGVIRTMSRILQRLAGDRPLRFLLLTMIGGAVLSLFMNNIASAAVLLPAVVEVSRRTRNSPAKMLMPLAFAANLGGLATLLATSNLLINSTLQNLGLEPFGLLDFAPLGLPLIAVGMTFMLLIGRRLLPAADPLEQIGSTQGLRQELADAYALEERLSEVVLSSGSPLIGKTIDQSQIGERLGLSVLAVYGQDHTLHRAPGPDYVLETRDTLLVTGRAERVRQLVGEQAEVLEGSCRNGDLNPASLALYEVVLAPRSSAAGRTLKELRFREKYGLSVVAIWRGGRPYRTDVGNIPLQFGDALLVHGPHKGIFLLHSDADFLTLEEPEVPPRAEKGRLAAVIMALTLLVAVTKPFSIEIHVAMMLGALSMIVTGCLTIDEAYRAVEWRAIFLIACMLPVGVAMTHSGAAAWLGDLIVSGLMGWGPLAVAGGMLFLAIVLSQVMSGQVTAAVLTPIAVAAAQQIGGNPHAMVMAVAMGCGMVFMTPTAHPVNVFVMGPGGYKFSHFLRVGLPLTLLLFLVVLALLPVFWPLG